MSEPPPYRQPSDPYRGSGGNEPTEVFRQQPGERYDAGPGGARYGQQPVQQPVQQPGQQPGQAPAYGADDGYRDQPPRRPSPAEERRRALDPGALWSGGVVTAVVAALVALAGLIVVRGIMHVAVLAPSSAGTVGDSSTIALVAGAFVAALLATAVLHALLITTPQPVTFFGWIVALVTVIVALLPFTTSSSWLTKLAAAALYVIIGLVIGLLLSGAGARARRRP